jgi:hypothetical protein
MLFSGLGFFFERREVKHTTENGNVCNVTLASLSNQVWSFLCNGQASALQEKKT